MAFKLPLGGLEFVLLAVLLVFAGLVIRGVRRRGAFQRPVEPGLLPALTTETRITGKLRRTWRDATQGLPMAEIAVGKRLKTTRKLR